MATRRNVRGGHHSHPRPRESDGAAHEQPRHDGSVWFPIGCWQLQQVSAWRSSTNRHLVDDILHDAEHSRQSLSTPAIGRNKRADTLVVAAATGTTTRIADRLGFDAWQVAKLPEGKAVDPAPHFRHAHLELYLLLGIISHENSQNPAGFLTCYLPLQAFGGIIYKE